MDIKKTLKEVRDYFVNKVISGDFEFKSCDEFVAIIVIDNDYEFKLWIKNNPALHFNFDNPFPFYRNEDFIFNTEKERLSGWAKVKPHVDNYRKTVQAEEKKRQIEKLTKELE